MPETISQALTVLLVGMTTVFFILALVVLSGRLMINILNKTNFVLNKKSDSATSFSREPKLETMEKQIIEEAIRKWSKGAARITEITKQ